MKTTLFLHIDVLLSSGLPKYRLSLREVCLFYETVKTHFKNKFNFEKKKKNMFHLNEIHPQKQENKVFFK